MLISRRLRTLEKKKPVAGKDGTIAEWELRRMLLHAVPLVSLKRVRAALRPTGMTPPSDEEVTVKDNFFFLSQSAAH